MYLPQVFCLAGLVLLCGFYEFRCCEFLVALECVMDYDCIAAGPRILFMLFKYLYPAYKHSELLSGKPRDFNILPSILSSQNLAKY